MTQHRWLKAILTLALLVTALVTVPSVLARPNRQSFSASLTPVAGTVQYLPAGRAQWLNVTQVTLINQGDQIRTSDDGIARLSVVTGIEVEIYPSSWVVLNDLALGQSDDALRFSLGQVVGSTFTNVTQKLDANDTVQVLTPGASASVRGTQFFVFVTADLHISILPALDTVTVTTIDNRSFTITPDDLARILLTKPFAAVCTVDYLRNNTTSVALVQIIRSDTEADELKQFLTDSLTSNVNPEVRTFLRQLLKLEVIANFATLSDDADQSELQELLQAIKGFTGRAPELAELLKSYRGFMGTYLNFLTNGKAVAPATCGNGRQDDGETVDNCALDFVNVGPTCGNGLCETERKELGESLINCPADCLPGNGDFALQCIRLQNDEVPPPPPPPPPPPG